MADPGDVNQLDERIRALGLVVLRLLSTRDRWVNRRVESISFLDSIAFQRRVSIDFSIDPDLATPLTDAYGDPFYYIPLGLLRKRKLVAFSLRDEGGRALSMPTSSENCAVAAAALLATAEANVGRQMPAEHGHKPPDDVEEDIWNIATEKQADRAIQRWAQIGRQDQISATSRIWRAKLAADRDFMALAYDFARNFLIMVPLGLEADRRRVIKYSYEYRSLPSLLRLPGWLAQLRRAWFYIVGGRAATGAMKRGGARRKRIRFKDWRRVFLGWFPQSLTIDTPAVFHGGNYHLEVEAPEGLQITRAVLYGGPNGEPLDIVRESVQRVHLYAADIPSPTYPETATAVIDLRVRNQAFVRAATMIAAVSVALLVPLAFLWEEITTSLSTVPSFLLVVPTGLAAYVARSREPLATTERLFGLRLLAMSAGAWSFLAAILLVAGRECPRDATKQCTTWSGTTGSLWVLAILSGLTLVFLARALTFGARPPEQSRRKSGGIE